jgi:hypothetical protein
MHSVSMDIHIEYLLSYLQDEFKDIPLLRIHPVAPTGLRKSIDLPQDYDPQESDLHVKRGVRIRVSSRDFFFPVSWVTNQQLEKVRALVEEIRSIYFPAEF